MLFSCGAGGFSIGLFEKVKNIDTKQAYKALLARARLLNSTIELKR